MSSIEPRSVSQGVVDDPSWLGSAHGTDATESITLDVSLFTEGTHYPDGYIPSGTPVAKVTASGLYGPYDADAANGQGVLSGFLIAPKAVEAGVTRIAGAMLTHGKVVEANLPTSELDANGKADVPHVRFV